MDDSEELFALARELEEHQADFVRALSDWIDPSEEWKQEESLKEANGHVVLFNDARARLRLLIGDTSALTLPGSENQRERQILHKALLGEMLLDELLRDMGVSNPLYFTDEELEPIAEDFLSWFSHYEYAQAKLAGAVLVVNAGELPYELRHFVGEIQECYAFQQHTAVYALCRTALEAGLLPVYQVNRLDHPDSANSKYVRDKINGMRMSTKQKKRLTDSDQLYSHLTLDDFSPTLDQMITRLCWLPNYGDAKVGDEWLRKVLHSIRDRGNSLIHANTTADRQSAKEMMRDLFQALHVLYEVEAHDDTEFDA